MPQMHQLPHAAWGGAYFAPELGNVMTRWGVMDDPEAAFETLGGWLAAISGIEERRQMPRFKITPEEMRA
jgi:nitric oxide reductase subunit C